MPFSKRQNGEFMINLKKLILYLAVSLGTGGVSAIFTMGETDRYLNLTKPPLSPAPIVFPIVWTVLFILMGIGAYLVSESECKDKNGALTVFFAQLAVNFVWPILFFNLQMFLFSFAWLLILLCLILVMIIKFYQCSHAAAYLQIPYILWVSFAGYLNLAVFILNR